MNDHILVIKNLTKDFPGVRAVNDVSFNIKRNTVHCLIGENGAGKSTLIKILTGALTRTSGQILLNGQEYVAENPRDAKLKGISTLFQELNVVDQLTVEENLTLGLEDTWFGFLRKTEKTRKMINILHEIEPSIDPKQLVARLSVAQKQLVEIAKAVSTEAEMIIMDEPTAAISEEEINYDDLLVSSLITLAPRKVTFHSVRYFKNKELLETIKNVFYNNVIICDGCCICQVNTKAKKGK